MKSLLLNSVSRTNRKELKKQYLLNPPSLSERALDPQSESAKLLGPFSKRREANIRKYFHRIGQVSKVLPPLEITGGLPDGLVYNAMPSSSSVQEIEGMVSLSASSRYVDSPQSPESGDVQNTNYPHNQKRMPTRWLRRRYRELLATIPIVHRRVTSAGKPALYYISMSKFALCDSTKGTSGRMGDAKPSDMQWIKKASTVSSEPL
jgi:hypothetical protein